MYMCVEESLRFWARSQLATKGGSQPSVAVPKLGPKSNPSEICVSKLNRSLSRDQSNNHGRGRPIVLIKRIDEDPDLEESSPQTVEYAFAENGPA